jgi:ubiquinone/menaquinone biosynthesis C-methylase UbiE
MSGLDIGCGEGYNTRKLAEPKAIVTGIDISTTFIKHVIDYENEVSLGIEYIVASALNLPFDDDSFDFVTGFMLFMNIPDMPNLFREVYRVLKSGGFLQFSVSHPCCSPAGYSGAIDHLVPE